MPRNDRAGLPVEDVEFHHDHHDVDIANINIDKLIGAGVKFDFEHQTDKFQPIGWQFDRQCVGVANERSFAAFTKQCSDKSTIGWDFAQQSGVAGLQWKFDRVMPPHCDISWNFTSQCPSSSTIPWKFQSHENDGGKILWKFDDQVDSIVPVAWRFANMCNTQSDVPWAFTPQIRGDDVESKVNWKFQQQTEQTAVSKWKFEQQISNSSACNVNWKFNSQLNDTAKPNWTFDSQLVNDKHVNWQFQQQSDQQSKIPWQFPPNFRHGQASAVKWNFDSCLDASSAARQAQSAAKWTFAPQVNSIRPVTWNAPHLTDSLSTAQSYDEIANENRAFKEKYAASYSKPVDAGRKISQTGLSKKQRGNKK